MWNNIRVVDVHGHISRPPQARHYAAGLKFLSAEDKEKIFHDNPLRVFTKVKALV